MLKIKDNVDLQELEKFGYEYDQEDDQKWYGKYLEEGKYQIFVDCKTREILKGEFELIFGYNQIELSESDIQDLIQAGLVEKESDWR